MALVLAAFPAPREVDRELYRGYTMVHESDIIQFPPSLEVHRYLYCTLQV